VPEGSIEQHLYGKNWEWGSDDVPWDHPTALLACWQERLKSK
jgi:hypothetical protein